MSFRPPRLAQRLIEALVPAGWREHLLGDMQEDYVGRRHRHAPLIANLWYWFQVGRVLAWRVSGRAIRARSGGQPLLSQLPGDLAAAWRSVWRRRGELAVLILVLGGGLGASTAVLAIADAYLWTPLPYPHSDRLMQLTTTVRGVQAPRDLSALDYDALGDVADLAVGWDIDAFTLLGDEGPQSVIGRWIGADVFPMFGAVPSLGRVFTSDEVASVAPLVVISDRLWQQRYGRSDQVLGRTLTLRGIDRPDELRAFTIIGVLPPRFWHLEDRTDLFLPLRGSRPASLLRAKAGLSADALESMLSSRMALANPDLDPRWQLRVEPLQERQVAGIRPLLQATSIAAVLLILITGINLSLLQAVRATTRRRELAVKLALGASRSRVARQLLCEGLFAAMGATALALVIAHGLVSVGLPSVEGYVGRLVPGPVSATSVRPWVLLFVAAVAVLATVVMGLLPVLPRLLNGVGAALAGHPGATESARGVRFRQVAVSLQVGATMALLVGAALMMSTAWHLGSVALGFEPRGVLSATLTLDDDKYDRPATRRRAIEQLEADLSRLPSVQSVGIMAGPPFGARQGRLVHAEGSQDTATSTAAVVAVNPTYFDAVRLTVLSGRPLSDEDDATHDPVAVVSQSLAEELWPDESALGRRLVVHSPAMATMMASMPTIPPATITVVGVAADVTRSLVETPLPEIYTPLAQSPSAFLTLQVRRTGAGAGVEILPAVTRAVRGFDPDLPLADSASLETIVAREGVRPRFLASVLSTFAGLAALVALVGVYAISAWVSRQRRREAALRVALGASPAAVLRQLVRQGAVAVIVGLGLGWAISGLLAVLLAGELTGISPGDVVVRGLTALLLSGASMAAMVWPALQVVRLDPSTVLRE